MKSRQRPVFLLLMLAMCLPAGAAPAPPMADVMAWATHDGLIAASCWAVLVVAGGWTTVWLSSRTRKP